MTPWQLAKDSESSQQMALFCFANRAMQVGFEVAKNPKTWGLTASEFGLTKPVPELKWLHHIPNGGSRGDSLKSAAIAGGRLKAEGVKAGVLDIFWPLRRSDEHGYMTVYCGLYIEMKKPSLKSAKNVLAGLSVEQKEFGMFAIDQGYKCDLCYDWLEAAQVLEDYYAL